MDYGMQLWEVDIFIVLLMKKLEALFSNQVPFEYIYLHYFSHFSITLIEYFICNIGITIQILLYKGAIHCSVQIPLNCLCWHVTNCAIYFCFLYYYILYICCVDTNMLSPVNRLVHKSMWHILKSMFSKIQHLNLKMYSLLFCLL